MVFASRGSRSKQRWSQEGFETLHVRCEYGLLNAFDGFCTEISDGTGRFVVGSVVVE